MQNYRGHMRYMTTADQQEIGREFFSVTVHPVASPGADKAREAKGRTVVSLTLDIGAERELNSLS